MDAGELDNPYTRETVASIKAQVEVLETLLRDKQSFLEAQLTRAQADISPEQYEEIKTNFAYFDKTGDGTLNKDEFAAVLKSLDLELTPEEEATAPASSRDLLRASRLPPPSLAPPF